MGQFRNAVNSQSTHSDDIKLTYLKTLLTGKAKLAIAYFAMYRDAQRILERKLGHSQTVVSAHLEKINSVALVKLHNFEIIISFACVISSLVNVFRSLSYEDDLKGTTNLNQILCNLPPKMRESWLSYTFKRNSYCPNILDFNKRF